MRGSFQDTSSLPLLRMFFILQPHLSCRRLRRSQWCKTRVWAWKTTLSLRFTWSETCPSTWKPPKNSTFQSTTTSLKSLRSKAGQVRLTKRQLRELCMQIQLERSNTTTRKRLSSSTLKSVATAPETATRLMTSWTLTKLSCRSKGEGSRNYK